MYLSALQQKSWNVTSLAIHRALKNIKLMMSASEKIENRVEFVLISYTLVYHNKRYNNVSTQSPKIFFLYK